MKRSDQRSNWEATIWEATAINSNVFKKPVVSQAISLEHTRSQPKFHSTNQEPQGVRIKIIGHSNTANDCGHSTANWPSESEHVSKSNVKHKSATASDLAPVEQPERLAKTIPDAEQQAKNNR